MVEYTIEVHDTVTITVPDDQLIPWETFVRYDTRENGGHFLEGFAKAAVQTLGADFFNDIPEFDFSEPRNGDESDGNIGEMELESAYKKIIEVHGTNSLKNRELILEVLNIRARHDDDAAEQDSQNMQMLEAFGWPETLEELTKQINRHFYRNDDYSRLVQLDWFRDYLYEILMTIEPNGNNWDIDKNAIFVTLEKIVDDMIDDRYNRAFIYEYVTIDFLIQQDGIYVVFELQRTDDDTYMVL